MNKKVFIIAAAIIFILAVGVAITKLTVHDLTAIDRQLKKNVLQSAYEHYDNPLERIAITLGKGRIVSVNPPASAEVQFFTLFHIPLGILRGEPNARLVIFLSLINPLEATEKIEKAKNAIKKFMNDPNVDLIYSYFMPHPSNFSIGKSNGEGKEIKVMTSSKEWQRPVYVFQEKKFINNDCQVYQYEVSIKTHQIIEIQTAWPQWFQAEEEYDCPNVYSRPTKSKEEVEKMAFDILAKDPEYTGKILVRSDIQPKFTERQYSYEWLWEDESVSPPEGLIGDPFQHPVIRIMMTKAAD